MTNALIKFEAARQALAEAKTIDEVKGIRDKAEAMRLYAKQIGESLEMQNDIAEIKIRAERRAGELLIEMNHNGERANKDDNLSKSHDGTSAKPTLSDLGLTKNDSSRWQQMAKISEVTFEQKIAESKAEKQELTSAGMLNLMKNQKKAEKAIAKTTVPENFPPASERYTLYTGDMCEIMHTLEPGCADIIITDPPYPKQYLHLYEQLAATASRVLNPGASLLVMVGQSYLPDVLSMLSQHLNYHWMIAYLTPGGQSSQLWERKVNTFWKPVLWFVNGKYDGDWIGDVARSNVNDNDKRFHHWGQSESGMADLIEKFTYPGQTILDPFCGGGTTGVVALKMNRYFIGIDIETTAIETTAVRLEEIERGS